MDFFPVLFAVPRVVGWLAHWRQMMHQQGGVKIWRPRQIYVGETKRDFVPIYKRETKDSVDPKHAPTAVPHSGYVLSFFRFGMFCDGKVLMILSAIGVCSQSKRTELAEFLGKGYHKL